MSVVTPLFDDNDVPHEVVRLRREVASLKRMLQAAFEEAEAKDAAVLKFHSEVKRLKAALVRQQNEDADNELVQTVFDFWVAMCKGGNPRAKMGPARVKKVHERVSRDTPGSTPKEFMKAIIGAAYDPFVKNGKVFNDLELICRDEAKFDTFVQRYYEVPDVRKFVEETGGDRGLELATALMDLDRRSSTEA
jgi:hypothetical protein